MMRSLIYFLTLSILLSCKIQVGFSSSSTFILFREANCLLFYTRGITLTINHHILKFSNSSISNKIKCHDQQAAINITFDNSTVFSNVSFSFKFLETNYGWEMNKLYLSITCDVNSENCSSINEAELLSSHVFAPPNTSYHCMKQTFKVQKYPHISVVFDKLQVQPFIVGNDMKFDSANDCIGFFSEGSLTVLFVSAILVGILSFGLYMIINIQTSDKFDNPKRNPINIAGSE